MWHTLGQKNVVQELRLSPSIPPVLVESLAQKVHQEDQGVTLEYKTKKNPVVTLGCSKKQIFLKYYLLLPVKGDLRCLAVIVVI